MTSFKQLAKEAENFEMEVYRALVRMSLARRWDPERTLDVAHEVYAAWLERGSRSERDPGYHAFFLRLEVGMVMAGRKWRGKFGSMLYTADIADPDDHMAADDRPDNASLRDRGHVFKHSHEDHVIGELDAGYAREDISRWRAALARLFADGWSMLQVAHALGVGVRRVGRWRAGKEAPLWLREDVIELANQQIRPEARYQGTVEQYKAMRRDKREDEATKARDHAARRTAERFSNDAWYQALKRLRDAGFTKKAIADEMLLTRPEQIGKWEEGLAEAGPEVQEALIALDREHGAGQRVPSTNRKKTINVARAKQLRAENHSWKAIGRILGCSDKGAQLAVEGPRPKKPGRSNLDVDRARSLLAEGRSWVYIASVLGCSDLGIRRAVERTEAAPP